MAAITFDTLKFADTLKAAGVPAEHAEAEARAVAAAIGEVDVATRRDLEALEMRLTLKLGSIVVIAIGAVVALTKLFA